MKLKKIASLVLAGVMAASMLAGCQTTSNDQPTQPEEPTNPVAGYSAVLESKLSAHAQDKIDMSDDADLTAALDYVVGNVGNNAITNEFFTTMADGRINYIEGSDAPVLRLVNTKLYDKMSAKAEWEGAAAGVIGHLNPTDGDPNAYNYYTKKDVNAVLLYAVDGGVELENAIEQVANDIDEAIVSLTDEYKLNTTIDGATTNFHYTGSVATCTKTFESGHGLNVTFIAVEIVRHIGK